MDRDLGLHARRGVLAEHARHVAERLRSARRLLDQLDEHDLARVRAAEVIARHEHAMADTRVVGHDEADAGLVVQASDDLARVALEDFDERALRPAAIVLAADAHGDAIAMHRFEHLARRQEHRRGAIVRQQEAMAVAMPAHRADDELRHALAQAVFVAAIANDLARVQQLLELRLQALPRRTCRRGRCARASSSNVSGRPASRSVVRTRAAAAAADRARLRARGMPAFLM